MLIAAVTKEAGLPMAELARRSRTTRSTPSRARRAGPQQRYMAFLSYSHRDEEFASWFHDRLETFRVPTRLVGRLTEMGPVPAKLVPIFRDRHELAAAGDLSDEIEEALSGSRFLIVLCSPAAAASRWIDKEIACFKKLHGEGRVLAAIIGGEPFASDIAGREGEECFPAALRVHYDGRGRATAQRAEPIAADLRESGDGRQLGLLKIVAGILGVGLDELAQRDAQRRHQRHQYFTAASIAGMLAASALAYTAIQARDEARDQRREAEGLVGFMLGDLRAKLEPVGRLDVLDAVGARALAFYEKQDKAILSDEALAQRSKALTLMGEIASARGDLDGALRRYREALAGTAEALRRQPDDPQRMFDHAQSVYWVGEIASRRGQIDEASRRFRDYRRLAERMIAADPANPKWRLEGVYAASNLGRVELEQHLYPEAAATFDESVAATERLIGLAPGNREYRALLLEALAYHADALDRAGKPDLAIRQRERQLTLLEPLLALERPDATLGQKAMIAHMALSRLWFGRGDSAKGLGHAAGAVQLGRRLTALEPGNADWLGRSADTELNHALLLLRAGKSGAAATAADAGCTLTTRLVARDRTVVAWRGSHLNCLRLRAELAQAAGSRDEAVSLARQVMAAVRGDRQALEPFALAQAHKLVGDLQWRSGDRPAAEAAWRAGLAAWPAQAMPTPRQLAERGEMLRGIGARAEGERIATQLAAAGYRQSLSNRVGL